MVHDSSLRGRTVVVAHPSADLYGADRVMLNTVEALLGQQCRVVVTVPCPGPLVAALDATGAVVRFCPSPVLRKRALRPVGLLRLLATSLRSVVPGLRLLRACRPDVVYVSTLTVPLWLVLARLTRHPTICHVHEAESGVSLSLRRALAVPLLLSSYVVANSQFSRDTLTSALPRLRGRTTALTNPVPGPPQVSDARTELTGPVRLLYVGRLSPRKGPKVAVAAVGELRSRGIAVRLDLVGSVFPGYEWFEHELRSQVARQRLDDRVSFAGFRHDVWPCFAEADVVVVPSVAGEPFGNTAVEAVLAARPVIASAAGGLPEAVEGFASAQVVPPGDAVALADAVEKSVADWPAYRTAARAEAGQAAERHALTRYADGLVSLVHHALQSKPERRREQGG